MYSLVLPSLCLRQRSWCILTVLHIQVMSNESCQDLTLDQYETGQSTLASLKQPLQLRASQSVASAYVMARSKLTSDHSSCIRWALRRSSQVWQLRHNSTACQTWLFALCVKKTNMICHRLRKGRITFLVRKGRCRLLQAWREWWRLEAMPLHTGTCRHSKISWAQCYCTYIFGVDIDDRRYP